MEPLLESPLQDLLGGARGAAEGRRLDNLAADLENGKHDIEGLRKAAKEFEAVFLNQLLKAMRATVPETGLFNGGGATKFYRQMHDAELAKALANTGSGLGIADLVVQQLAPAADAPAGPGPVGPPSPPPDIPRAVAAYRRLGRESIHPAAVNPALRPAETDTLRRHGDAMNAAARRHGLAPELVLAVVMEESGGATGAESHKGARGLMQLMPGTARELGVVRPEDPAQNLDGGSRYLAEMLDRYDDDLELALAAYNAGPGNVDRAGGQVPPFPETRRYVARVLDRYRRLTAGTELASDSR